MPNSSAPIGHLESKVPGFYPLSPTQTFGEVEFSKLNCNHGLEGQNPHLIRSLEISHTMSRYEGQNPSFNRGLWKKSHTVMPWVWKVRNPHLIEVFGNIPYYLGYGRSKLLI
ncbi:hypothetical protein AVEN_150336-1 [Araneus ventricosus]|uniref:Uncharacterized protein n=1 Tax=Araneus ventricosus TaxID=182803 RepID=A0A4Y2VA14_ARAVE|nr:hypothetical protein AVEN_150336-1 [Araneus ventricosus]